MLKDAAMLISVSRTTVNRYRKLQDGEDVLNNHYGIETGIVSASKRLFAKSVRAKAATNAMAAVDAYVKHNTYPWLDRGVRLLPAKYMLEFFAALDPLISKANEAIEDFADHYADEIADDMAAKKGTANANDYPDLCSVRQLVQYDVRPVPDSGDFRVDVEQRFKDRIDQQNKDALVLARRNLVERILSEVSRSANRLETNDRLHATILSQLKETTDLVAKMDFQDDAAIAEMCENVAKITAMYGIEDIRKYPEAKAEVSAEMRKAESELKRLLESDI